MKLRKLVCIKNKIGDDAKLIKGNILFNFNEYLSNSAEENRPYLK